MFNLGAGEVLVILLLALIVLGPQRLPDAARQVGRFMSEIRKLSSGFQNELRTAFDDETEAAARRRGGAVTQATHESGAPAAPATPAAPPSGAPAAPVDQAKAPAKRPPRRQPLRPPSR